MSSFYREILGFSIERDWEGWIELRAGAVLWTLRKRGRPYDGLERPVLPESNWPSVSGRGTRKLLTESFFEKR